MEDKTKFLKKWALPASVDMNSDFEKALFLLENSYNNLFITGSAGTGKSTLLKIFRENTSKSTAVLAPTGVAALNVKGQTIHSFFKIPPNITVKSAQTEKLDKRRAKLICKLDCIVIDEVSMVRSDMIDIIDILLRRYREAGFEPFGGVQMIFFGDLFQLPPIVATPEDRMLFRTTYKSQYFFDALVFEEVAVKTIELSTIYRQKDDHFIGLLNNVRNGVLSGGVLEALNQRCGVNTDLVDFGLADFSDDFSITLTTTNAAANAVNTSNLKLIKSPVQKLEGYLTGEFPRNALPTFDELELKIGAQVMMLNNDSEKRWVNGSVGRVVNILLDDISGEELIEVDLDNGELVEIERHKWEMYKYSYNEKEDKIESNVIGSFKQFPLKLAFAVTIHKSQGKTFDSVIIDTGRGAFAHGQIYVALSRCTSLSGISLKKPIRSQDVIVDRRVVEFFSN